MDSKVDPVKFTLVASSWGGHFKAKIVVLSSSAEWLARIENNVIGEIGVLDLSPKRDYMQLLFL